MTFPPIQSYRGRGRGLEGKSLPWDIFMEHFMEHSTQCDFIPAIALRKYCSQKHETRSCYLYICVCAPCYLYSISIYIYVCAPCQLWLLYVVSILFNFTVLYNRIYCCISRELLHLMRATTSHKPHYISQEPLYLLMSYHVSLLFIASFKSHHIS